MDAALEVAVARQDGRRDEAVLLDGVRDRLGQRPRVADAGGAAVAHQVEAQLVEERGQAGAVEVAGHRPAAGGEARLDPGRRSQAPLDGLLGQQPRAHHHRRVGGVGAARDGRDRDRAGGQREAVAIGRDFHGGGLVEGVAELAGHVPQRHPVLGPARPGQARLDRAEVELEGLVELRVGGVVGAEQPLGPGVGLRQGDRLGRAAGQLHVAQGLGVDREHGRGRPELGRHVRDRGPVGQAQRRQPGPVELHELPDHAVRAQHLGHGQHQVGGGRAGAHPAAELEADHGRGRLRERLAQQHGLGLDAADAEAEHADAVDHRRVRVGPDQGVGEGGPLAVDLPRLHDRRQVLQVHLVDDPRARRHRAEVGEGLLGPPQQHVALAVALVLALDVGAEGARVAEAVNLHRVVDHQVGRHQRVDQVRVAPELGHRVAHRRQVDHARDAGEVLHHDPGRQERHLGRRARGGPPRRQGPHVVLGHEAAAAVAQHALQQHLDRVRRAAEVLPDRVEAVDGVDAPPRVEGVAGGEGVRGGRHCGLLARRPCDHQGYRPSCAYAAAPTLRAATSRRTTGATSVP